jgi:hypothetical protein
VCVCAWVHVCACVGDGKAAKELSTRAHAEQKSRDDANHKAAAAIFRHQNPKGADGLRCDLHGLHKVSTNTRCFVGLLLSRWRGTLPFPCCRMLFSSTSPLPLNWGGRAQCDRTKRCISSRSISV